MDFALSSMKVGCSFSLVDLLIFVASSFRSVSIFVCCCTGPAFCVALYLFCRGWFLSTVELASVCSLARSSFLLLLFSEVRAGVNLVQQQELIHISLQ
jgi:hypothetical protein